VVVYFRVFDHVGFFSRVASLFWRGKDSMALRTGFTLIVRFLLEFAVTDVPEGRKARTRAILDYI
jgi:hypothetical protein